jgi:formate hydrogenlyase subunit 6/NADH:ubiquinone oxidoreductase subunit I
LEIVDDLKAYFENIKSSVQTLSNGMKLTLRNFWEASESRAPLGIDDSHYFDQKTGISTLQYPFEAMPVPDNGRYRLHNEIEDCIVCDKCAKICPVDCIEIEPIRAVEEIGTTSDGSVKRIHAAKFNIDMAKCCYCGLCTTVCPTECLTMTKTHDFSVYDVRDHTYAFAEMTPIEILEKRQALEQYQEQKEKQQVKPAQVKPRMAKPAFMKPSVKPEAKTDGKITPKPVFRPKIKPKMTKPNIKPKPDKEDGVD